MLLSYHNRSTTFSGENTLLHLSAARGDRLMARLMIMHGTSLEARNQRLETPLHVAVQRTNLGVVDELVSVGAHIGAQNHAGQTSLVMASLAGSVPLVKRLVFGATPSDVAIIDKSGRTALDWAR